MSKKENPSGSKFWGVKLIITALLLFLLGVVGFAWARSSLNKGEPSPIVGAAEEHALIENITGHESKPELVVPLPSATAPAVPTAISTIEPTATPFLLPSFENPISEQFVEEAAAWGVELLTINDDHSGVWQYETNNFVRPIALETNGVRAFLLDGGRVLSIDLTRPEPPVLLLSPGDEVSGVRVLEPLDLALIADTLFVLDRAGDVYRYNLISSIWTEDRYDRPVEASSGHYFVAIDIPSDAVVDDVSIQARTLLETNYKFAMQYGSDGESLWNLPEGRSVDVSVFSNDVYVLQREMFGPSGMVTKYRDTRLIEDFAPKVEIDTPRQIVASDTAVYVLDKNGRRLLGLDPIDGKLLQLFQLPQEDAISVFAVDSEERIYLAGSDRLYLLEQPDQTAYIPGGLTLDGIQPHDPSFLGQLNDFTVPIGGSNITFRDFQMPGAPRHYRLGVHEGLDFYWQPGTKILAAADGLVIRADLDYVGPTAFQLATWWNTTQEQGYTTPEILDNYLGRQVWIEHRGGLVTRYAHLSRITPGIAQGVEVSRGQIIGEVGNSGSPASLESEKSDAHLHFEMWLGDTFLGQFMRPIETREWIERILTNRR